MFGLKNTFKIQAVFKSALAFIYPAFKASHLAREGYMETRDLSRVSWAHRLSAFQTTKDIYIGSYQSPNFPVIFLSGLLVCFLVQMVSQPQANCCVTWSRVLSRLLLFSSMPLRAFFQINPVQAFPLPPLQLVLHRAGAERMEIAPAQTNMPQIPTVLTKV